MGLPRWPSPRFALPSAIFLGVVLIATTVTFRATSAAEISPLERAVFAAEREFGVPSAVLLAVSHADSFWIDHGVDPSYANGFGVMHLQDNENNDNLRRAAELLGRTPDELKSSIDLNVRGGAALLREAYRGSIPLDQQMAQAGNLERWYSPVAKFLRSDKAAAMRSYADHVFFLLERGVSRQVGAHLIRLPATPGLRPQRGALEMVPDKYMLADVQRATSRYPDAIGGARGGGLGAPARYHREAGADQWVGTPNYNTGRSQALGEVVIHDCEGQYSGCLSTLQNNSVPLSQRVSAHFLVRSSDGWVAQLVHRADTAWHAKSHNPFSLGIEHEGYAATGYNWYNGTLYRESSWVTAWTCYEYWFGCDRAHVVGHQEFDPLKGDPGPYWDWNYYMTCVYWRMQYINYQQAPQACY